MTTSTASAIRPALLVLPLALLLPGAGASGGEVPATGMTISFKLDPRLTQGLYMGERWVSRSRYRRNGPGPGLTIELRAHAVDALGGSRPISPEWVAADPEMIAVSPGTGHEVGISVRRAGQTSVEVRDAHLTGRLSITALSDGGTFDVEIEQEPDASPPDGPQQDVLDTERARASYALGLDFGVRLRRQVVALDESLLQRGLEDALAGAAPLLTAVEVQAALAAVHQELRDARARAESGVAEQNLKQGAAFLAANATRDGVVSLPSGLQYRVLHAGSGAIPASGDTVVCHYRGTLVDGTVFDSSFERGKPATLALTRVISGWNEALQLMPVGSRWQLFVPPSLAYGARGARAIPPGSTLLFEIQLLSIQERSKAARSETGPRGQATEVAAASP